MRYELMDYRFRFLIPIMLENITTVATTLIYSVITGTVSKSSLAAVGVGNQAISLVLAFFAIVTSGCAVITATDIGRKDIYGASRTVEHTLSVSLISSVAVSVFLLLISGFTMKLLMPGAEEQFLAEGTLYYRTILFSVPPMVMYNAMNAVLRAKGDSRDALIATIVSNVVQLLLIYVFVSQRGMGVKGVALAFVCCRCCAAFTALIAVLQSREGFCVQLYRIFLFDKKVIHRVLRVGIPVSLSSIAVHAGYTVINSLLVSLGTLEAGAANVLNAIQQFTCICQVITTYSITTIVGQECGSGNNEGARKSTLTILKISVIITVMLCLPVVCFPRWSAGLFSTNEDIIAMTSAFLWIVIPYSTLGQAINVLEPAVQASGDTRFAMMVAITGVWGIRVPLSLLFCMVFGWGIKGVYAANIISFVMRATVLYVKTVGTQFANKRI